MKPFTDDELLSRLKALASLCHEHGVKIPRNSTVLSRLHTLEEILRARSEGVEDDRDNGLTDDEWRQEVLSITEAIEWAAVYDAYQDDFAEVKDKVALALDSPPDPAAETLRNVEGRNTLYELMMASILKLGGADVLPSRNADVRLQLASGVGVLECKRLQSLGKMEANLRAAKHKLFREGGVGIVSVSLSKFVFQDWSIHFDGPTHDVAAMRAGQTLRKLAGRYKRLVHWLLDEQPYVAGILFTCNGPCLVGSGKRKLLALTCGAMLDLERRSNAARELIGTVKACHGRDTSILAPAALEPWNVETRLLLPRPYGMIAWLPSL